MTRQDTRPAHALPVFTADLLTVVNGANLGDSLAHAAELQLEDTYALRVGAEARRLSVMAGDNGHFTIAARTAIGTPGATVVLDCCLTLMTRTSEVIELLVLVETDEAGHIAEIYGLPLAPLEAKTDYLLVGIDRDAGHSRLAQLACVSFTRGTHITLSTGEQRAVETLAAGDKGPDPR
ncbi:hypothetical protein [Phycobium rhodophyticola]